MTLAAGQILQNRYCIVSLLGQGGMGAVYRAWDTRLDVYVALKEMVPQPGLDPQRLDQLRHQFQSEAKVLARLEHPNLVDVSDFFVEERKAYLVMKFIAGESLAEHIRRHGALSEERVLVWADQLLDALAYCHSQGIIHRDVKPQNVIIRPDGQAILVDFGLVKMWDPTDPRTRTAIRAMGTPEYAPPEQYDPQMGHTDARSDIYSLGATLYHALSGQAPPTVTQRVVDPTVLAPLRELNAKVSPAVEVAVMRALALQPVARYGSAADLAKALKRERPFSPSSEAPHRPAVEIPTRKRPGAPAPEARTRLPVWIWAVGSLMGLAVLALAGRFVMGIGDKAAPTPSPQVAQKPDPTPTLTPNSTPTTTPSPPPTRTLVPSPTPTQPAARVVSPIEYPQTAATPFGGGGRIAFVSSRDGNQEIYIMDPDGSRQRNLTNHPSDDSIPAWSPDGMRIAFESNRGGNWDIYLMNSDGSGVIRVTDDPADDRDPDWSPDGTQLVFHSNRGGDMWRVWVMEVRGGGATPLTANPAGDWAASWSPDGQHIVFASRRDEPGEGEIYVMNADGSQQENLTNNSAHESTPHWSPDGTQILFYSTRDGNKEVYRMRSDGSGEMRLTSNLAEDWLGTWSPDGRLIVFTSDRDGSKDIYVMSKEARGITRLTDDPAEDWNPVWSADQAWR